MKKYSKRRYQWLARRHRGVKRRQLRLAGRFRSRRLRDATLDLIRRLPLRIEVPAQLKYYSPRNYRRPVEDFFLRTERHLAAGTRVQLNFSHVERLYPCGALVLMGSVDSWIRKYPGLLSATYPRNDLVEQMLQHVEVLQKLGLPPRKEIVHDDVTRWHYFHGRNADATPIEPFMLELQALLGEEQQVGLGNCVTEAMINVRHHAYDGDSGGPWWIFATITERRVFIALYDRGDSIPATLLAKPELADYVSGRVWSSRRGDPQLIAAAVGGRTRTKLPYRGKGLPEMLEFTKKYPNSHLGILSRHGLFRYDTDQHTAKLSNAIAGTLVIWILDIPEQT